MNQNVRTLLPQVVLQTVRRGGGGEGGSSSNGGSEAMEFIAGVLQKEKRVKHLMADHFSIIYIAINNIIYPSIVNATANPPLP